jgi:hypothetical protein
MEVKLWNICPQNWLDKRIICSTHIGSKLAKFEKFKRTWKEFHWFFHENQWFFEDFEILGKGWFFDSDFFKYLESIVLWKMKELPNIGKYPTSLVALTLIILFSEMLKCSDFFFFQKQLWKKILNLKNKIFVKMN